MINYFWSATEKLTVLNWAELGGLTSDDLWIVSWYMWALPAEIQEQDRPAFSTNITEPEEFSASTD